MTGSCGVGPPYVTLTKVGDGGVSRKTLSAIVNGRAGISPEMALRLSRTLGRSAESWLAMQDMHDLAVARSQIDLAGIEPLSFDEAAP